MSRGLSRAEHGGKLRARLRAWLIKPSATAKGNCSTKAAD